MFSSIFALIIVSFQWVTDRFTYFFEKTGAVPYFIAFFSVLCVVRFLVVPLLGHGLSSDRPKKDDKANKSNKVNNKKGTQKG